MRAVTVVRRRTTVVLAHAAVCAALSVLVDGCARATLQTALTAADRPGYTFGTATVPVGGAQAEVGYTDNRVSSLTYQTLGEGLLRIGVAPRTELRLFGNSYALRNDAGLHTDGLEDAKLGIKQRLWAGSGTTGFDGASLALLPAVSMPVGSEGFGVEGWQPELLLAAALPLSPTLSLVSNVGDAYVQLADERAHKVIGTLAAWYTVSSRLSVFGEYGGTRLARDAHSTLQYFDAGIAVLPVPAVQLDLRAGHGVNGVRNDNYIGVGLTRRW